MGMLTSVTLSSVGTSAAVGTDWMSGKPITAVLSLGSTTMTTDATIQYTVDNSSATRTWLNVVPNSSVQTNVVHYTSAWADSAAAVTFTGPIAGLRISSTAISSSSLTLKVLQGIGW